MADQGYVHLEERGVLAVRGPEARSFLQGLVSNDVERLTPDHALYAALLTPQGKYLFDFIMMQRRDEILLDVERARLPALLQRLTLYRLRAKVELEDASERFAVAALLVDDLRRDLDLAPEPGAARPLEDGVLLVDPRLADLGARIVSAPDRLQGLMKDLGLAALPEDAYEARRLELGIPEGERDMVLERATLLESGFEELHGVDFKKGCFVGQELTARMKYRGLVRKRLMPVRFEGPAPEPGAIVRLDGRDAGEVRSSANGHGIALLRLEQVAKARASGTPLKVDETVVIPEKPPWANFQFD